MTDTSKVRNKLANRSTDVARAQPSQAQLINAAIDSVWEAINLVLPSGMSAGRFRQLVYNAIKANRDLARCLDTNEGKLSLVLSVLQGATMGLELNTPAQQAWLLPRRIKGTWECQLSIGYKGYLKLARRSGSIKTIFADVVREHDWFHWSRGLEADEFEHRPAEGERGPLVYAYAVARFMNGGYDFEVLDRHQIEARRAMSDSWKSDSARPYSPWTKWPEQMWKKTALRSLASRLDLDPEASSAFERDETRLTINEGGDLESLPVPPDDEDEPTSQPEGQTGTSSDARSAAEPGLPLTVSEGSDSEETAGA